MLQHVAHDIGQVLLRHQLLLVTQFDDAFCHLLHRLLTELQAQFFEVLADIGLAARLTQCILTFPPKAFRQQVVAVEVILVVTISMYASYLREYATTHNGFVWWDSDTAVALHQVAHLVELLLVDVGLGMEVVLEDGLHTSQGGVTCTLSQSVDSRVESFASTEYSSQHIAHGQVVVVVGMKIKMHVGISLHHLTHVTDELQRVEHPQGIGQHDSSDTDAFQPIHQLENVVR